MEYIALPMIFYGLEVSQQDQCDTTSLLRVGWFFRFNGPLKQFFSLYRAVSQREGERREMIDERKMSKQPPPAHAASAMGPCPTVVQISRTPQNWKFTIAPPEHPTYKEEEIYIASTYGCNHFNCVHVCVSLFMYVCLYACVYTCECACKSRFSYFGIHVEGKSIHIRITILRIKCKLRGEILKLLIIAYLFTCTFINRWVISVLSFL